MVLWQLLAGPAGFAGERAARDADAGAPLFTDENGKSVKGYAIEDLRNPETRRKMERKFRLWRGAKISGRVID